MADSILSRRWPWLTAAALVVLFYLSTFVDVKLGRPDDRSIGDADDIEAIAKRDDVNLLFVLIDTLRADHLGAWGYGRDTSPTLDHLASRGVRFAHQLSQSSWTKCSMASLWTGLYPVHTGVTRFNHVLPDEAVMPAELFRDAGFATAGLFRNGWVEGYFGFDQGFDLYSRPLAKPPSKAVKRQNPTLMDKGTDENLVSSAAEFIRIHGHERWFLYLHFMDVHEYVYDEDTAVFGSNHSDGYDNAILRENMLLDRLFIELKERGALHDTVVVIASDHGEAFGERGHEGHARRVYRETTEVPLIFSFPFALAEPAVVTARTRNVDIWPTLLELMGLPPAVHSDGVSRMPEVLAAVRGETPPEREQLGYAHLDQTWGQREAKSFPTVAVRDRAKRFVVSYDLAGHKYEELFDADTDPAELDNLVESDPEDTERLRELAEAYLEQKPPWESEVRSLEIDEVQLNQLRALGYKIP